MRRAVFVALSTIITLMLPAAVYAAGMATFNSNTDSAAYGNANEANFLRVKNSNSPNPGFSSGAIDVNSDAVLLQAYVSNDSSSVAQNAYLTITLPTGFSTSQTATATLKADNASAITDSARMADSQPFSLAFDQGAQVYVGKRSGSGDNNYVNAATSDYRINGNVMSVHLGDWAGGDNQQGTVTVRVSVLRNAPAAAEAFACTSLQRSAIDNNRSTFTAYTNWTAAVANISSYNFVVKDSAGNTVANSTVSTTAQSAVYNFSESKSGVYTVTATSTSDKGTTAVNSSCTQSVTVPAVLSTVTTTTSTPKALPNTGAGDVLGIFAGTSVLGTAGHYITRRFKR